MPNMELLLEAEKRGILPPEKAGLLQEARKRGLAPGGTPEPQSMGMGEMMGGAIKNFPGSAVQFAKDITAPIHSPVQTAKGLGNLAVGGVQKMIPGEQGKEQYADAVGKFFADRYGGMENVKTTLRDDPVGFAGDLSAILTGGGLAAAKMGGKAGVIGQKVADVGAKVDPLLGRCKSGWRSSRRNR